MKLKAILILAAFLAVAGSIYYFVSRPKPAPEKPVTYYVWDFDQENLQKVTISLPKTGQSENFIKHPDDRNFYFDVVNGPKVDNQRWGGGIPLLLSGPGATRLIVQNATAAQLKEFGFDAPNMVAMLTVTVDGVDKQIEVQVGDSNPDVTTYYVRLASNQDVYTVDKTWYDVLSGIVINPPYVPGTLDVGVPTATPASVPAGSPVTISVNVGNLGDVKGTFTVNLLINNEPLDSRTVTLEARSNQVVNFKVIENKAGTYYASINAAHNVSFTVK